MICIKQVTEICIFMEFPWPSFALNSLWTGEQEIGMLIMDHNGNGLNGFIVLSQIGFNWIMDMMVGISVEGNAEHAVPFFKQSN